MPNLPSYVNPEKCDGCKGRERTACMYICPNDLMLLDRERMKAFNQEPEMCWECYSCVKICPQSAIEMRGYSDFVPLGARVTPMRGTDAIMWLVRFRNGQQKRFRFAIRTRPEGTIQPYEGLAEPSAAGMADPTLLAGDREKLGVPKLPTREHTA